MDKSLSTKQSFKTIKDGNQQPTNHSLITTELDIDTIKCKNINFFHYLIKF